VSSARAPWRGARSVRRNDAGATRPSSWRWCGHGAGGMPEQAACRAPERPGGAREASAKTMQARRGRLHL
jgi:hypothetical protein